MLTSPQKLDRILPPPNKAVCLPLATGDVVIGLQPLTNRRLGEIHREFGGDDGGQAAMDALQSKDPLAQCNALSRMIYVLTDAKETIPGGAKAIEEAFLNAAPGKMQPFIEALAAVLADSQGVDAGKKKALEMRPVQGLAVMILATFGLIHTLTWLYTQASALISSWI
jgi:hypothetical protein